MPAPVALPHRKYNLRLYIEDMDFIEAITARGGVTATEFVRELVHAEVARRKAAIVARATQQRPAQNITPHADG